MDFRHLISDVVNAYYAHDRPALDFALLKHLARCDSLYDAIAHGDDNHRAWLKQAIENHFAGKPVQPESKGSNAKKAQG